MRGSKRKLFFGVVFAALCLLALSGRKSACAAEEDFVIVDGVLVSYTGTDTEIVIPDGVKEIARNVFPSNMRNTIVKLTIPDSVVTIREYAFMQCDNLEIVEGMQEVKVIENYAFNRCRNLKSINLSAVETLGDYAFAECSELSEIRLPKKLVHYGNAALSCETWLQKQRELTKGFVIVNGILIDGMACEGKVIIPETVREISDAAFCNNKKITEVVLHNQIKEISSYSFRGCTKLKKINLDNVEIIGDFAFDSCTSLKQVVLAEKMEYIGKQAFYGCVALSDIQMPKKLSSCKEYAFNETAWLTKQREEVQGLICIDGILIDAQNVEGKVIVPDTVQIITGSSFWNNYKLTEVVLPKQVKEIGNGAFAFCSNLTKINLESVEKIGSGAFLYCSGLTELVLSESVKEIADSTFEECTKLKKINLNAVEKVGKSAFEGCKKLTQVGSLSNVTELGQNAFLWTALVRKAEEKNGLVIIDGILFNGKNAKGTVSIPKGVRMIAPLAFSYNKNVEKVLILDSVVSIGYKAFEACTNLRAIRMEDSVRVIEHKAFSYCHGLQNIRLSNQLTKLDGIFSGLSNHDDTLFGNIRNLKELTLPEGLTEISWTDVGSDAEISVKNVTVSPKISAEVCSDIINGGAFGNAQFYTTNPSALNASLRSYLKKQGKPVQVLKLNQIALTLKVGQTEELAMNSGARCTWKSLNPSVVSVTNYGLIKAKKAGTAVIRATIYGKNYWCKVTVE